MQTSVYDSRAGSDPYADAIYDKNGDMSTVLHYMARWLPLSESFVYELMRHTRHRAFVVSRFAPENLGAYPHRPLLSLRLIPQSLPGASTERRAITASLMALIAASRAKVLHVHHGYRLHDVAGTVRRLGIPLVVSFHGEDVTGMIDRHGRDVYREIINQARAVIVPSRFLADVVAPLMPRADALHVIPSGVDGSVFVPTPLPATPEVLFIGRFVEKKGIDVLLEAWPRVREEVPRARLRLLGYGPLEPSGRTDDAVEVVLPDVRRRAMQVRDAIRRARVVVSPSRTASNGDVESMLLVNLEAQASGRPVVTTNHGGIPEFVAENRTALLVPERNPAALADALVRVLTDDALAARLAAAGPEQAGRFDVAACAARVDRLYASLAS
jgi:glycosyltransferase involved in cell wall biosynthesis